MTCMHIRERARARRPHRLAERPDTHWLNAGGYVVDVARIPAIPTFTLRAVAANRNARDCDHDAYRVFDAIRRWRLRVARENDAARLRKVEADNPPETSATCIPGRWYQERLVLRATARAPVSADEVHRQQRDQLGIDVQRGTLRRLP